MRRWLTVLGISAAMLAGSASAQAVSTRPFEIRSKDGATINGQADLPSKRAEVAVILVAGTGLFDRDATFGRSGTPRDKLFADLARRLTKRGAAAVRYDRRGVRHGRPPAEMLDKAVAATSTVETQRDDLRAVYDWTRASSGLGARCVVLLAHSEGMAHVARIAAAGAPPPAMVLGIGALMESPAGVIRWQMTGRDVHSLKLMDADRDGRTTNAEVEANWRKTPSSAFDRLDLLLQPDGVWTADDLQAVTAAQTKLYDETKKQALAKPDADPYPTAATPMARYSWWKSWFTDEGTMAGELAAWRATPVRLHYGAIDSQAPAERQLGPARAALGDRVSSVVHPGRGHSLGEHALFGPMDEALADQIAEEAAAASCG